MSHDIVYKSPLEGGQESKLGNLPLGGRTRKHIHKSTYNTTPSIRLHRPGSLVLVRLNGMYMQRS